jgi:hypothetical protein
MSSAQSSRVQVSNVTDDFLSTLWAYVSRSRFFFPIKAAIKFYIIAAGSMVLTDVQGAASVR